MIVYSDTATYPFVGARNFRIDAFRHALGTWSIQCRAVARVIHADVCFGRAAIINVAGINGGRDGIRTDHARGAFHVGSQLTAAGADAVFLVAAFVGDDLSDAIRETRVDAEGTVVPHVTTDHLAAIGVDARGVRFGAIFINHLLAEIRASGGRGGHCEHEERNDGSDTHLQHWKRVSGK